MGLLEKQFDIWKLERMWKMGEPQEEEKLPTPMPTNWYGAEVLINALFDIIEEADQSNGGNGARLPIVVHIRSIADEALRKYGSPKSK